MPALTEYGDYLDYGRGGPADKPLAVKIFQLAADQEDAAGFFKLAYMYYHGRGGLGRDFEKSKELFLKSVEKGHRSGQDTYDRIVEQEELAKHDIEGVIAVAEGGDIEAKCNLARYYRKGVSGLKQDKQKALDILRLLAEGGHGPAMYDLAFIYENGDCGVQKDDTIALEWYRQIVDQGGDFAKAAIHKIAQFYENGCGGLEANIDTAKEWYTKAGTAGEFDIHRIETPERNRAEVKRLTEAAESGDADALYQLGHAYFHGTLGLADDR